jgi:hypothetical protein
VYRNADRGRERGGIVSRQVRGKVERGEREVGRGITLFPSTRK